MNRGSQLAKNTIIIIFGKICTQCISFLLLPVYTALLSPSDYGVIDLLNTYVMLLVPIVCLRLDNGVFRFLIDFRNDEENKKIILSSCFFGIIVNVLIYTIIIFCINYFFDIQYFEFLYLNVVAYTFSQFFLESCRGIGNNKAYSLGSFIVALVAILFNILFIVYFRLGAEGMLLSYFISYLVSIVFVYVSQRYYSLISIQYFSLPTLKKVYRYSIPLIPNSISWWIINSSDRIIVSTFLSVAANGIYSAANKFSGLFITIYSMFNMTFTESISLHINDNDASDFISKTINTVLHLFICIALGIIAFMPFIFNIMIDKKFSEAYLQVPILMIASLLNIGVGICTTFYVATKQTKKIAIYSVLSAIINISVNIIFIKQIGLFAASISTAVAYLITIIFMIQDVKKMITLHLDMKFLIISFLVLLFSLYSYYQSFLFIRVIALLMIFLYSLFWNYSFLKRILSRVIQHFRKNVKLNCDS